MSTPYGVGHFKSQFLAIGDWSGEPISRKYDDEEKIITEDCSSMAIDWLER